MTLLSLNPANGTVLRNYDALNAEAVNSKIADAQQAFEQYSETRLEDRVMWLKKLAGILEQEMEELATLLSTETGKTIRASREEVLQCASCCRYYAENAAWLFEEETVDVDANRCVTKWQPMGVLLALLAEVGSFWQVFRLAVPALLGGNTVVLKHSVHVPQCALEIEVLLRRAGFARGVFQSLLIEAGSLVEHESIVGVAITMRRREAREMAAHMTWLGKKTVVDQDGAQAFLVMPSANLFAAIQAGVAARCVDNGQSNASAAWFVVHEDVYDEFAMLFTAAMEDVKIGNPLRDETELGPLMTEEGVALLRTQIASLVASGGKVLTGGESMMGDGHYFEPTVVANVPQDAPVCREEIQGPVALLFRVKSLGEAISLANAVRAGGVSAWTQDEEEQQAMSRRLLCGSVYLNSAAFVDGQLPGGAMTQAGRGRAMARTALHTFMTAQTMVTAHVDAGEEFNFDLTLDEFEKEAQMAEAESAVEMEGPEVVVGSSTLDLEELEVEDDLFVLSQVASEEEVSLSSASTHKLDEEAKPVAVAVPQAPPMMRAFANEDAMPTFAEETATKAEAEAPLTSSEAAQPQPLSFKEMFEQALQVRV